MIKLLVEKHRPTCHFNAIYVSRIQPFSNTKESIHCICIMHSLFIWPPIGINNPCHTKGRWRLRCELNIIFIERLFLNSLAMHVRRETADDGRAFRGTTYVIIYRNRKAAANRA